MAQRKTPQDNPFADPSVAALRELLNKRPKGTSPGEFLGERLPPVPQAAPFRTPPFVQGSPDFARMVEDFLTVAPEIRGQVPSITQGYGRHFIRDLLKRAPQFLDRPNYLNLAGMTGREGRDIEVNTFPDELRGTLAHELRHGVGEADDPERLGEFEPTEAMNAADLVPPEVWLALRRLRSK